MDDATCRGPTQPASANAATLAIIPRLSISMAGFLIFSPNDAAMCGFFILSVSGLPDTVY
jgi:hypothetical protein